MKNKGFTLIELLVVIAIIGILANMLLPTLAKAKTKANRLKCTGNLKSVAQAFQSYSSAYEGTVPQLDPENTNANGHRVCKAEVVVTGIKLTPSWAGLRASKSATHWPKSACWLPR